MAGAPVEVLLSAARRQNDQDELAGPALRDGLAQTSAHVLDGGISIRALGLDHDLLLDPSQLYSRTASLIDTAVGAILIRDTYLDTDDPRLEGPEGARYASSRELSECIGYWKIDKANLKQHSSSSSHARSPGEITAIGLLLEGKQASRRIKRDPRRRHKARSI